MIHDVDETLRTLVRRDVTNGGGIDVSFDAPNRDWAARRQGPSINLYLYDVREDLERRRGGVEEVRDERGVVIERRRPPRRFKLSYLVTAWTQRPEDEHRLLAALLRTFVATDVLPADLLQGELGSVAEPIPVTVALPPGQDRSLSDVWSALGGELKPSLDLIVTTPFGRPVDRNVGPPVLEGPLVTLFGPDGQLLRRSGGARNGSKDSVSADDVESQASEQVEGATFAAGSEAQQAAETAAPGDVAKRARAGQPVNGGAGVAPGRRVNLHTLPRRA